MPRVSVIMPAYNAEAHIAEALRSVEAQTYPDWEVVIGDDASTDGTTAIAEQFARVTTVSNRENAGPAAARNLAVANSSGELLAFLDADDYWLPDFLAQQVALFDRHRDAGIVTCDARLLGDDGFLPRTYIEMFGSPERLTKIDLLRFNPIFKALSPRAAVEAAGGFQPGIFGAEDWDMWLKIVELGYAVVANRSVLAVYRVTGGSVSSNPASMARAKQLVYRGALERGNLTPREHRVARRELRLQRAVEQMASAKGLSIGRALPLVALAVAEHPRRWPSYVRSLVRGKPRFAAFDI
jgi:teichuronic acid biosynthesis glycosyltransferase TuaG